MFKDLGNETLVILAVVSITITGMFLNIEDIALPAVTGFLGFLTKAYVDSKSGD